MDAQKKIKIIGWKEKLNEILEQHIYRQNQSLKKVQNLSEEVADYMSENGNFEYREIPVWDRNLYGHLLRTTLLSLQTAVRIGLNRNQMNNLSFGCMIHDLGLRYVCVPYDNCDVDNMSPRETYELKKHTILGYTSLEGEEWIPAEVKDIVLSHHETMDGKGYPLKQKNQGVECRIAQVCDKVDSMISGIEQPQGTLDQAKEEIQEGSGTRYDGEIVETVLGLLQ